MSDNHLNLCVAVVDDDPELVKVYQQLFSHNKIPVSFVAYDGLSALDRFRRADPKPTIIIIDYRMPIMNGIELMKEVLPMAPDTKIIFISADDRVRVEALNAGACAFLNKPARIKEIMHIISALTG